MAHFLLLGFVVFFFILVIGRICFDYRCAIKNKQKEEIEHIEIPLEGKHYTYKKLFGVICLLIIPSYWLFAFFSCSHLYKKNDTDSHIIFWLLVDSIIPITIFFLIAFISALRSYVFVYQDGFDHHGPFRKKVFLKDDIENICRTEEFIFIKGKGRKVPLVIEAAYHDSNTMYRMLCGLTTDA